MTVRLEAVVVAKVVVPVTAREPVVVALTVERLVMVPLVLLRVSAVSAVADAVLRVV